MIQICFFGVLGSKLRMQDEHTVYFLIDRSCHPSGAVVGLLKVGKKNLFLVDGCGSQKQVGSKLIV